MTQKDKELLIKDISSRIPYGVKGSVYGEGAYETNSIAPNGFISLPNYPPMGMCEILDFKPYLFPLSSMTEEQYKEFNNLTYSVRIDGIRGHHEYFINPDIGSKWLTDSNGKNEIIMTDLQDYLVCIDWLNEHHFDYRGLIDKGLAIDATNLNIY